MPEDHIGDVRTGTSPPRRLPTPSPDRQSYTVNEGDGAFYGPKLDFHLDSSAVPGSAAPSSSTCQLPERFELEYTGADGEKHRPVMIHRVVFGSIERFIGIITEHFAGAFPVWLSPVQVKVMPITDRTSDYAKDVAASFPLPASESRPTCAKERSPTRPGGKIPRTPPHGPAGRRGAKGEQLPSVPAAARISAQCRFDAFIERITGEDQVPQQRLITHKSSKPSQTNKSLWGCFYDREEEKADTCRGGHVRGEYFHYSNGAEGVRRFI